MWLVGMQNNMAILEKFQFLTKPSTTDKAHNVASTPLILYLGKKNKIHKYSQKLYVKQSQIRNNENDPDR